MKGKALLWATLFVPGVSLAQEFGVKDASLDAFYMPGANIEARQGGGGSFDETGSGYGVKALAHLSDLFMATGEYQTVSYDIPGADRDDYRVGAGVGGASGSGLFAEYVSMETGDGFGVHGRLAGSMTSKLELYGQAGYVQVKDQERFGGFEFSVGGSYGILDLGSFILGAFVDYRLTNLDASETGLQLKFRDTRVGVRLTFAGSVGSMPAEGDAPVDVEPVAEPAAEEPAAEEEAPVE